MLADGDPLAKLDSASESSLFAVAQRLVIIPFVGSLALAWWHLWVASALCLGSAWVLEAMVSDLRVGADTEGIRLGWLWLSCKIPWTSIRTVEYRTEFIGGRFSFVLWTSQTLTGSSFGSLQHIESLATRYTPDSPVATSESVGLPWWLVGR